MIRVPIPSSTIITDPRTGLILREWFVYFEQLGIISGNVEWLPDGDIFVGGADNRPTAVSVTGDINITNTGVVTLQDTANVREIAQDAVGTILTDTGTVDLAYNDGTPSITATARYQMSIDADASGLKLLNDETSPGVDQYYGTDSGGTKGWFSLAVGPTAAHWEPVSNMNPAAPELVFDATTGDVVMGWVS